jgi:hypothetical protein
MAFTAWHKEESPKESSWIVDSGSTGHMTGDRSQFTRYQVLTEGEVIQGVGKERLEAVGIGEVELICRVGHGLCKVTLQDVLHVPDVKLNLFSLRKATEVGAEAIFSGKLCQIAQGGRVGIEAILLKNGLWEIQCAKETAQALSSRVVKSAKKTEKVQVPKQEAPRVEVDLWEDEDLLQKKTDSLKKNGDSGSVSARDSQQQVRVATDVSNSATTQRHEAVGASRSMEKSSKAVGASNGAARSMEESSKAMGASSGTAQDAADNVEGHSNLNGTPQRR